jgi:hypothetical protein
MSEGSYKITAVDISDTVDKQVYDTAEARMHRPEKEQRGIKGYGRRLWDGLTIDFRRWREQSKVRKEFEKEGDVYATEQIGSDPNRTEEAKAAVIKRFETDVYDDFIDSERGETREKLGGPDFVELRTQLKEEIIDYVNATFTDANQEEEWLQERKRQMIASLFDKDSESSALGLNYADNFIQVARTVRARFRHEDGMVDVSELSGIDIELVRGNQKQAVRSEVHHSGFEKAMAATKKIPVLGTLINETTVGAVTFAAVYFGGKTMLTSASRVALSIAGTVGGIATGALFAGVRSRQESNKKRTDTSRRLAQGLDIGPNSPERKKFAETVHEMRGARTLIEDCSLSIEAMRQRPVDTSPEDLLDMETTALESLVEIDARLKLSSQRRIDLISYSTPEEAEQQNTDLVITRAQAKLELVTPANRATYSALVEARIEQLIGTKNQVGSIAQKDAAFAQLKNKEMRAAMINGAVTGSVLGLILPELVILIKHLLPVEEVTKILSHAIPVHHPDQVINLPHGGRVEIPVNTTLEVQSDGSYQLHQAGKVVAEHIKFDHRGHLTPDSYADLASHGLAPSSHTVHIAGGTHTHMGVKEAVQYGRDHGGPYELKQIARNGWNDNNTVKIDHAELGQYQISAHGEIVLRQNLHLPSWHGKHVDNLVHEAHSHNLSFFISPEKAHNKFGWVFKAGPDGRAIIPHGHPAEKLFTVDSHGEAKYHGGFIEQVDGTTGHGATLDKLVSSGKILSHQRGVEGHVISTEVGLNDAHGITMPTVQNITTTKIELPPPPVTETPFSWTGFPIVPPYERVLEPMALMDGYLGYGYMGGDLTPEQRKRLSDSIRDNPDAKLDHFNEAEGYIQKFDPEWAKNVEELASQLPPMNSKCRIALCLPVLGSGEEKNIYSTLRSYSEQKDLEGNAVDPEVYEIVVFVNYPVDHKPDNTELEIKRFHTDFPNIPVRMMKKVLPKDEANMGTIRKYATDATLLRHHNRGNTVPDLIIGSNDGDNEGVGPNYIHTIMKKFNSADDEGRGTEAVLGKIDWDPKAYVKEPLVHMGTRFFQFLDIAHRHPKPGSENRYRVCSSGANFAFKSSIYAAIGGYEPGQTKGEDNFLGCFIRGARKGAKDYPIEFGGAKSIIYTNARRALIAVARGLSPSQQWSNIPFGPDDGVRNEDWEEKIKSMSDVNYKDPAFRKKYKRDLQHIINQTIREYGIKTAQDPLVRQAMRFMEVEYRVVDTSIFIDNADHLLDLLEKEQESNLRKMKRNLGQS